MKRALATTLNVQDVDTKKRRVADADFMQKQKSAIVQYMVFMSRVFKKQLAGHASDRESRDYALWHEHCVSLLLSGQQPLVLLSWVVVNQFAFLMDLKITSLVQKLIANVSDLLKSLEYSSIEVIFSNFYLSFEKIKSEPFWTDKIEVQLFYLFFSALGCQYLKVDDYQKVNGQGRVPFLLPMQHFSNIEYDMLGPIELNRIEKDTLKSQVQHSIETMRQLKYVPLTQFKKNLSNLRLKVDDSDEVDTILVTYAKVIIGILLRCYTPNRELLFGLYLNLEQSLLKAINQTLSNFLQCYAVNNQLRECLFLAMGLIVQGLKSTTIINVSDYGPALVKLVASTVRRFARCHLSVDAFLHVAQQYPFLAQASEDQYNPMVQSARDQSPTSIMLSEQEVGVLSSMIDEGYRLSSF